MKTKIIPFDLETAKKIQAGEIEGRIVTNNGYAVRIICFDKRTSSGYPILGLIDYPNQSEMCKAFNVYGLSYSQPVEHILHIELPEEAPKYEFKPFDKVLVRDYNNSEWCLALYAYYSKQLKVHRMVGGSCWIQCIPYKCNEHLLGTTSKQNGD